ncbi:MAG TPA: glycine cleavage T C-terminal barrel domain-containing protein [Acidimicrobiales bacterium]|nr:glycine cleavage T C-terminal barrel domain-containing protein [Acidimicrobiales bacterium]
MSLVDDYEALYRDRAGRVLARDVLLVHGPDAESYLQGQCTQDVAVLDMGSSTESLVLSPQGKVDGYVRITRQADDAFLLDTEAGFGSALRARLERFKLRVKAEFDHMDWLCVSVRGPASPSPDDATGRAELAVPFTWDGARGIDLLGPEVRLPDGVRDCDPGAWEAWRIEVGIPALGRELDERTIPAEAGLLERCVSFTKGCYTGQELVARLDSRGNRVARHLRAIVLGGEVLGGEVSGDDAETDPVPAGSEIADADSGKVVGSVTSSAWSPVNGVVALGYVHRDVVPPAGVVVRVNQEEHQAVVRALPLAR